ncbi:MAG: SspB family protein [Magnetospiraceae bacterium]
MSDDPFAYKLWIEEALRSVVRRAMEEVEQRGLAAGHHFYITFATDTPGVEMPDWLASRYPQEMTIVLQFEYWNLWVEDDAFGVTLSFSDTKCALTIPFDAVVSFADPAVKFGLQFTTEELSATDADSDELPADDETTEAELHAFDRDILADLENSSGVDDDAAAADDTGQKQSGEVIALDTFRKK